MHGAINQTKQEILFRNKNLAKMMHTCLTQCPSLFIWILQYRLIIREGDGRYRMIVGVTTNNAIRSVPITTNVISNLAHGEVYAIQHYIIKFLAAGR